MVENFEISQKQLSGDEKVRYIHRTIPEMESYLGKSTQEWTEQNLWKTAFKQFEGWSA